MGLLSFFNKFKKVLIIEDDQNLRAQLVEKFQDKGYTVVEAGDAHEALTMVGIESPSAMVLDLILPLKDGISLLEELRNTGYNQPVVILSNLLGSDELRNDAEKLGAEFYNKSRTSLDEVVTAVESAIAKG